MTEQSIGTLIALMLIYFIPSIVAVMRGKSAGSVLVINTFLGWTLLFWVIALAMSLGDRR